MRQGTVRLLVDEFFDCRRDIAEGAYLFEGLGVDFLVDDFLESDDEVDGIDGVQIEVFKEAGIRLDGVPGAFKVGYEDVGEFGVDFVVSVHRASRG